jgi:two-component system, chemotaxis family, response regulator Rcp1
VTTRNLAMNRITIGRPTEILLVEDNLDDARVTIQALQDEHIRCRVTLVRDGEEAMSFLRREGVFSQAPRPDVILLDMELPKKDGREVLAEVRGDEALQAIPVLVLTASAVHRAVLQALNLYVDGYMTKPVSLDQFILAVKSLRRTVLAELVFPAASPLRATVGAK